MQRGDERRVTTAGAEAWRLLFGFVMSLEGYWEERARELGLPHVQAYALMLLEEPTPMNRLSTMCHCDPSTLTGVVDRLEARGYVERRPSAVDRRVKLLTPTPEGEEMRRRILQVVHEPHPAIASLSGEDQRALRDIFRRAFGERD